MEVMGENGGKREKEKKERKKEKGRRRRRMVVTRGDMGEFEKREREEVKFEMVASDWPAIKWRERKKKKKRKKIREWIDKVHVAALDWLT